MREDYFITPSGRILGFWVGPFYFGVELNDVYQIVTGDRVVRADRRLYRYENMPLLNLDHLMPVRARGEVCVILWHEDAIGGLHIDGLPTLVRAPAEERFPIPETWLRPGHAWVRSVFMDPERRYPAYLLNVPSMLHAAQEQTLHETP